jgi:site-specific DNA recombinase
VTPEGVTDGSSRSDNNENGMLTAVIYLRVSTKEQAEKGGEVEGYSIPAQREVCKRKIASLGAVLVEEFADRGESGTSIRRPELQRMLVYLKENPVAYVVVHKIDRLARNTADNVSINLAVRAAGATLVSSTENIDETPSGEFMHTILSGMATFYSRNLALEVIKGSTQKAKTGGTVGRAPLGYLNVRRIENGREVRTVEIDPVRGPLMKWAFEAYASGDWTLRPLLDELTHRGLASPLTRKTPEKPLELSHLHKLLRHPYYKGIVRYRGAEYPGKHEPLVSEATWERVQRMLAAKNQAGERHRVHHHYLRGSLFCGSCGSRMIVCNARNRHGQVYPYFVCLGRHQKRTDCTFKAALIETVEQLVEEHYGSVQLTAQERDMIAATLSEDFAAFHNEIEVERKALEKHKKRLLGERSKLLQAHYADAVPLDLLRSEQARIADQLAYIGQRVGTTTEHETLINFNLQRALKLATDVQKIYVASADPERRLLNQAFFNKLIVHDDHVESELAEPYDILLSPTLRTRAQAVVHLGEVAVTAAQSTEPNWTVWETSYNDDSAYETPGLVGAGKARRPLGRQGSNNEILVGAGGFEPPKAEPTGLQPVPFGRSGTPP